MYPYVEIQGMKFSLVAPYTINDQLIIRYRQDYSIDAFSNNIIYEFDTYPNDGTINHYSDVINDSNIVYINDTIYRTILLLDAPDLLSQINSSLRMAGYDSYFTTLLQLIQLQCEYIDYNSFSSESYLENRIHPMLRKITCRLHENITVATYADNNCISSSSSNYRDYRDYIDSMLTNVRCGQSKHNIIHAYNYVPRYKKHKLSNEDLTTTPLLGAEIEVDKGGENEDIAIECLKIMNGSKDSEENIYCVHDGSLTSGLEMPTMPGTLAWHKTLSYEKLFKYLDNNGYAAHDTNTCGLHIHINRDFFGDQQYECIGRLIYIIERFVDEFSVLGRRDCRFSKLMGYSGEKCKDLFAKGSRNKDKYNAVNLLHKDTIEIRAFKGTLKYSTFINTLEFVRDLVVFVKEHTDEEIENMEWSDLMETFSGELKAYYEERQKKQTDTITNNKKINGIISSLMSLDETLSSITYDNIMLNSNVTFVPSEKNYRKKIKQLKTQIAHAEYNMNYLAIRELNQELEEAQKEYKKYKRNNRNRE